MVTKSSSVIIRIISISGLLCVIVIIINNRNINLKSRYISYLIMLILLLLKFQRMMSSVSLLPISALPFFSNCNSVLPRSWSKSSWYFFFLGQVRMTINLRGQPHSNQPTLALNDESSNQSSDQSIKQLIRQSIQQSTCSY